MAFHLCLFRLLDRHTFSLGHSRVVTTCGEVSAQAGEADGMIAESDEIKEVIPGWTKHSWD
jgi:hypothetical protein